jgi:DNA repair ATPase RecN
MISGEEITKEAKEFAKKLLEENTWRYSISAQA